MATIEELQAKIEKLRDEQATTRRSTHAEQQAVLAQLRASYPKATDGLEVYAPQGRDLAAQMTAIEGELTSVADAEMASERRRSVLGRQADVPPRDPRTLTDAELAAASSAERVRMATAYGHLLAREDLARMPPDFLAALTDVELAAKVAKIT